MVSARFVLQAYCVSKKYKSSSLIFMFMSVEILPVYILRCNCCIFPLLIVAFLNVYHISFVGSKPVKLVWLSFDSLLYTGLLPVSESP